MNYQVSKPSDDIPICTLVERIVGDRVESYDSYAWKIPDILGYIQNKTELTRSTIHAILSKSDRIGDIIINPQLFLDLTIQAIKRILYDLMIDGIKYQKLVVPNMKWHCLKRKNWKFI